MSKIDELEKRVKLLEGIIYKDNSDPAANHVVEDQLTLDLDKVMINHGKKFENGVLFSGMAIPSNNKNHFTRWSCSGGFESNEEFNKFIDQASADDISKFCNCFSSGEKLLIIRALIKKGSMTQKEILEYTEISQGQFYHHIKDLISNKLIEKNKSQYELSTTGHVLSVSFTGIINTFIK